MAKLFYVSLYLEQNCETIDTNCRIFVLTHHGDTQKETATFFTITSEILRIVCVKLLPYKRVYNYLSNGGSVFKIGTTESVIVPFEVWVTEGNFLLEKCISKKCHNVFIITAETKNRYQHFDMKFEAMKDFKTKTVFDSFSNSTKRPL